jgi:hypothetical protein
MENGAITPAYLLDSVTQVRFYRALHQCVSQQIGLLPQQLDLRTMGIVLDLACGPDFWVRDVAATYPHLEVIGLDLDPDMVLCAQKLTPTTLNQRAQFMQDDMCEPMLGRHCVDLLHLRFLASTISPLAWMDFIDDITHLCRPGGCIVWTEAHMETNSTACNDLYILLQRAMGKNAIQAPLDVTPMMDVLLGDTICQQIKRSTVQLDLSVGTPLHASLLHNMVEIVRVLQPFLLVQHVDSIEEIDRVCREFIIAVHEETFVCLLSLVTVTGHIPLV